MTARLSSAILVIALLSVSANAKDKKKSTLPEYILKAETVLVVISPDAGEPIDQPMSNAKARENVEKALMEWGRLRLVMEGEQADLVISVRTANGRATQPTIHGGPIDRRPGSVENTDSTIRIGAQQGQPPPLSDPSVNPPGSPHVHNEIGSSEDMFEVYRGNVQYPLDASPVWRYTAKNCLREPGVTAVEEFRKAIAKAEQPPAPKKP